MVLNPDNLRLVIATFSIRLKHPDPRMRKKAALVLGKVGDESLIPFLCQALDEESDIEVQFSIMDAILLINETTLPPMSETPQGSKYNFVNPQNVQIIEQGDGIIHNYAQPQNLAESAREIQELLAQLSRTYPTNTDTEKEIFVAQVDEEIKKNSRLRSILLAGGIELLKILCPPLGIPIEMGRKWLETARSIPSSRP